MATRGEETSHSVKNLPGLRHTLLRGSLLGAAADFLGCFIFFGGIVVVTYLAGGPLDGVEVSFEQLMVLLALITFMVALLPAIVGGAAIALILRKLSNWRNITATTGLVIGASMGFLAGFATLIIANSLSHPIEGLDLVELTAIEMSAALAGGWHGWQMTRWLQQGRD